MFSEHSQNVIQKLAFCQPECNFEGTLQKRFFLVELWHPAILRQVYYPVDFYATHF